MTRVFVMRPFGTKEDSAKKVLDFERVHKELIGPALKAAGLSGGTTGEIIEAGNIREDMFLLILEADLVICDTTTHNANVFYELGMRHACRKKHTILIKGGPTADKTPPFDVLTDRYCPYNIDDPASSLQDLVKVIQATLYSGRETDSPIFRLVPGLTETNPLSVQVLPLDFREEVERAQAAKSKGWLRLLARDVSNCSFHWAGLQLVANAQWRLEDYEGARDSFEEICKTFSDNVDVNLALANIYQRIYRKENNRLEILTASDQMIERVLTSRDATPKDRTEALTLKGRNQKTRWQFTFKHPTVGKRRRYAMNQTLRECYKAYRNAFYQDLNHFYSGLNTLQIGTIFLDLSEGDDTTWKNSFDSDDKAETYRQELAKTVESLKQFVPISIEVGLNQPNQTNQETVWAKISQADMMFLTEKNEQRVIERYKSVMPKDDAFAWNAAKNQLEIFADLDIRANLANAVIAAVDSQYTKPKPNDKPLHVILFAGHRVDAPRRAERRFPPGMVDLAKQRIQEALSKLDQNDHLVGMASGAPGADILFHEVCDELHISSKLCLPMPVSNYASLEFKNLDSWRFRFFKLEQLRREKEEVLVLSDREGLPNWLHGAKTNPWERGNDWVLQMALTQEAKTITLIALWDGKDEGDAPGGTAHMVHLAERTGRVNIERIDAKELLK